jgi:hypothetical protein
LKEWGTSLVVGRKILDARSWKGRQGGREGMGDSSSVMMVEEKAGSLLDNLRDFSRQDLATLILS